MALNIAQFKVVGQLDQGQTNTMEKSASTTNIKPNDMVALDSNKLAIRATATSTEVAFCVAVVSDTQILVSRDITQEFEGTADAPFAKTNRNTEVDIAIDGDGNQLIDLGASTTDVFKVTGSDRAGTVGSADKVRFVINKMIAL